MRLLAPSNRERRSYGTLFFISFTISVLLTAFYHTQVVSYAQYETRAQENRLRPVVIPAPRGTITDRNGEIVATSIPGFSLSLIPGPEEDIRATLMDLKIFLGLSDAEVERIMRARNQRPHDLVTVSEDATFTQVATLEERRSSFPNLLIVERPKRYYPPGEALGHLIGYVSEISREELELPQFKEAGYRQRRWIGKAGIERQYEMLLSGEDGARFVEVDAKGRIVNPRSTVEVLEPVPGEDLRLTLDLGLQMYVEEIFPDSMKGSIVAMVPSTGEILAMYSNPSYDPNNFVGGISSRIWNALSADPLKPLLHRSVAAHYPPASTFKLATAAMGLQAGIVNAESRMPISCGGGMYYAGRYARCWYTAGHGSLNLVGAIEKSCNVYFYQLGIKLGVEQFIERGTRLGFARETGLDLPDELPGQFPTSTEWWERRFGYSPQPSEVMSLAIGQGPNSQTPLAVTQFYSALAGNGRAPTPRLAYAAKEEEDSIGGVDLGFDEEDLQTIWAGLGRVVNPGGTAWLSSLERWKVYGKTGTAQNTHGEDHGWFAGFAGVPGERPEIAVVTLVEHGLHGSDVAPLATKAMNFYLNKKYGLPFDPQPILLERWNAGRCLWGQTCTATTREQALYPGSLTWGPRGLFPYPKLETLTGAGGG